MFRPAGGVADKGSPEPDLEAGLAAIENAGVDAAETEPGVSWPVDRTAGIGDGAGNAIGEALVLVDKLGCIDFAAPESP